MTQEKVNITHCFDLERQAVVFLAEIILEMVSQTNDGVCVCEKRLLFWWLGVGGGGGGGNKWNIFLNQIFSISGTNLLGIFDILSMLSRNDSL